MIAPLIPLLEIRAFRPDDFAHDRYLYLPSVGFAMLAAFALRRIPWSRMTKLGWAGTQTAAVFSIALLMIFGIISQIYNFANNDAFYEYNARAAPNNKIAQSNLAAWMAEKGNYPRARAILTGIVDKDATDWDAVYMLGYTSYKMGRLEEAEQYFIRAVRMNPAKADAHLYLGLTRFRMERVVEAEADIRQAIQIRPARFGYHFALGIILKSRGELTDALSEFRVEAANFPSEAAARQQIMEIEERLQRGRTEK